MPSRRSAEPWNRLHTVQLSALGHTRNGGDILKKFLVPVAAAAIMTGAAYAQTEFHVVQDTFTRKCAIVD